MIIVSEGAIQEVAQAISFALIGGMDHHKKPHVVTTIDPGFLRNIALAALTAAAGDVVWPQGKTITKGPEEHLDFVRTDYGRLPRVG